MNYWFIAILILGTLDVGINMAKHGEERGGHFSFWTSLFALGLTIFLVFNAIQAGF